MKIFNDIYEKIISPESLFKAWDEFKKHKTGRKDVREFEFNLEVNILQLHTELKNHTYSHGRYHSFFIQDPKQRSIHKAFVRDRVLHHALFTVLNPIFEPTFIYHSYSCRKGKGTHKGVEAMDQMLRKVSKNNTRGCFVLKCDIKKFFNSVDHEVLLSIINKKVKDEHAIRLIRMIVASFETGIPIGNLTSQLFANVYMNEFDQFVKQVLKAPHYLRYTDDFMLIDTNLQNLKNYLKQIELFLNESLKLSLHPQKIIFRKFHQGVDFLGYVQFPDYRLIRVKTKRRIFRKIQTDFSESTLMSYLGVLDHCDGFKLSQNITNLYWFKK